MVKPLRSDRRRGQRRGWLPCPPRLEWLIGGCYSRPSRDTEDHPVQARVVTEVHGRPWKDIKAHGDRPGHSASQAACRGFESLRPLHRACRRGCGRWQWLDRSGWSPGNPARTRGIGARVEERWPVEFGPSEGRDTGTHETEGTTDVSSDRRERGRPWGLQTISKDGYVYHCTRLETAFRYILESRTLQLNPFSAEKAAKSTYSAGRNDEAEPQSHHRFRIDALPRIEETPVAFREWLAGCRCKRPRVPIDPTGRGLIKP